METRRALSNKVVLTPHLPPRASPFFARPNPGQTGERCVTGVIGVLLDKVAGGHSPQLNVVEEEAI